MKILGVEIDFDFTSPKDMRRYKQAYERKCERAAAIPNPTVPVTDPGYIDEYIDMVDQALRVFGDFLNEAYGDGVADQLLGDNPSMTRLLEVQEAEEKAYEQMGEELGRAMARYAPNPEMQE